MWLKDCEENYERIAVHVDDVLIDSKDPHSIVDTLISKYHFKHKGTGPVYYHLGFDFGRDEDGTLHFAPRKHIENMEEYCHRIFGSHPKRIFMSPLEKGNDPDLDAYEHLDQDMIQKHQSLIGDTQ